MSEPGRGRLAAQRPAPAVAPRPRSRPGASSTRSASASPGSAGIALPDRGAIVLYMLLHGLQFVRPRPVVEATRSRASTRARAAGSSIRSSARCSSPSDRDRGADRRRDRRLAERVRPARGLARAVESPVEIVAGHSQRRPGDLWAPPLLSRHFGFPLVHRRGRGSLRPVLPMAGMMMSLIALPLIVGATREALQASRPTYARRPTRSARTGSRRFAGSCFRAPAPGSPRAPTLGMGRIAGDTAIVVILLGGPSSRPVR